MERTAAGPDVFDAIADPQRRRIIELLAPRERSVNEIALWLGLAQPLTSKHLKVLKDAGLVDVRVEGKQRFYALRDGGLRSVNDWTRQVENFWKTGFDRLDELLVELNKEDPFP